MEFKPIEWTGDAIVLLDQTKLPHVINHVHCEDANQTALAIQRMVVRGAPAIGVTAAFAMALEAKRSDATDASTLLTDLEQCRSVLAASRPTAVNLSWALDRLITVARKTATCTVSTKEIARKLEAEALLIVDEEVEANRRMGQHGAKLIANNAQVLTHCNTGTLATVGYGTAGGIIRAANDLGKTPRVWVDETRPFLQGSRLTTWELMQHGINCTLICDNMAASLMLNKNVDLAIVGADRIAANGDVANKIGTYNVAVLCHHHNIPFYVAAPTSTIDLNTLSGKEIPIEQRSPTEVTTLGGTLLAPDGVAVHNPAFDVTPHELITGIVTETGLLQAPYVESLGTATSSKDTP